MVQKLVGPHAMSATALSADVGIARTTLSRIPQQMRELKIEPHAFHGDLNYTIHPRPIAT